MYSWRKVRTLAAILLLIPPIHLAFLMSQEAMRNLNPSPEVWADEIQSYIKLDEQQVLPESPMVLVGGRRLKLWTDLDDLAAPMPVLNRSLGDATTNDITHHYHRLIGHYQPHTVVLLPGESEFHIRDNKTAEQLVLAIQELVKLDLSYEKTQHFYVFAPIKTPLYHSNNTKIEEATRALKTWAATRTEVDILDANPLLTDRRGNAKPGYFRADGVNLNDHGYVRLSMLLRDQLETHNPEIYLASGTP